VPDRDVTGGEIDQIGGNKERRKTARTAFVQGQRTIGYSGQAADAGGDYHAGAPAPLFVLRSPAGIFARLGGCGERIDDEPVHFALVLGRHPIVGVEETRGSLAARDLSGDLDRQVGNVERLNRSDARHPLDQTAPVPFEADPERRHQPHAGHYDASHILLFTLVRWECWRHATWRRGSLT